MGVSDHLGVSSSRLGLQVVAIVVISSQVLAQRLGDGPVLFFLPLEAALAAPVEI